MSEQARARQIQVTYEDGTWSTFDLRRTTGEWVLRASDIEMVVTGYTPPDVLRVLSNALGTREVASEPGRRRRPRPEVHYYGDEA